MTSRPFSPQQADKTRPTVEKPSADFRSRGFASLIAAMKGRSMIRLLLAVFVLSITALSAQDIPPVRRILPPAGAKITEAARATVQTELTRLTQSFSGL